MANFVLPQTIENGPNNFVFGVNGILDTSDIVLVDLIDTTLASFQPFNLRQGEPAAFTLQIRKIEFAIEDGLAVNLFWGATADLLFATLVGRGKMKYIPPMTNNSGAGRTGKVRYSTQGWSASAVLSFNLTIYGKKAYS